MKRYIYSLAIAASALTMTSCLGDLDTLPLNSTDKTASESYSTKEGLVQGLAYIYGSYSLVSQNDPGSSDISVSDAGQSELVRQYVVLNEMSADAFKCTWGDSYISETQYGSWTSASNSATVAVYTRGLVTITRANEYLAQTKGSTIEGASQLRAEARFLRAYAYWMLLDLYGNPPFATEENIGGDYPTQIGRSALFEWVESELKDIMNGEEKLPETNTYPRVSKGAAQALLARMYLNAEVYTGKARWQEAKDAAAATIAMGYQLCPVYEQLFLQDNSENANANQEMIFAVSYDSDKTQSWGGTTHLISGALDDGASSAIAAAMGYPEGSMISRERWNGYHVPDEYVAYFDLQGVDWSGSGIGYDKANSDKRAFFANTGCKKDFAIDDVKTGWRCWKWSSRNSDGSLTSTDAYSKLSSADFPMIRLAEMYLIYAEAQTRIDGTQTTDGTAVKYINELRTRAGVSTVSYVDLDFILQERARELMWEGHRRVDLIRYGYFTSAQFPWPYKGGVPNGKVSLPSYRTIYPLLQSDVTANPNLKQNPGY